MQIVSTLISMAVEEAREKGEGKGGLFGRIAVKRPMSKIELHYFPFLLIDYRYEPMSWFFSKSRKNTDISRKINIISILCDATTRGTALVEVKPPTVALDVQEENVQEVRYSKEEMEKGAHKMAFRLLRKHIFGGQQMTVHQVTQIYRPFYVAFYGEKVVGEKVRYMPFAADGYRNSRTA